MSRSSPLFVSIRPPGHADGRFVRTLGRALLAALAIAVFGPVAAHSQTRFRPDDVADLGALERAFEAVVAKTAPSVVSIRSERHYFSATGDDLEVGGAEQRVRVNGSGTVIRGDGLILTNEHVIQGASRIEVQFYDGQKLTARVRASDARSDLAVLEVDRQDLQPIRYCDWNRVRRGQWTVVLGNPFGLAHDGQMSVSVGVISNLGRQLPGLGEVDDRFYNNMIQFTAPINPGNSGGPLLSARGELLGVITAMHTRAPADEGIGFAIPMTLATRRVIETLCRGETVEYGYIGMTVRLPTETEMTLYGLDDEQGVVVDHLEPDGPAAAAGVQIGDVLLQLDGWPVLGPAHMAELVGLTPVGDDIEVDGLRNGEALQLHVHVERRDISRVSWMRSEAVLWRGMRVANIGIDARRLMQLDAGAKGVVVIDVTPQSAASRAGLEVGDVIEAIDTNTIRDTTGFLANIRDEPGTLRLSVRNRGTFAVLP